MLVLKHLELIKEHIIRVNRIRARCINQILLRRSNRIHHTLHSQLHENLAIAAQRLLACRHVVHKIRAQLQLQQVLFILKKTIIQSKYTHHKNGVKVSTDNNLFTLSILFVYVHVSISKIDMALITMQIKNETKVRNVRKLQRALRINLALNQFFT